MTIVVQGRFRGPPGSGNGGYVAGLLARAAGGHRAIYMRAPTPLDTPLDIASDQEPPRLMNDDKVIAEAVASDAMALPDFPAPPSLEEARAASGSLPSAHPNCFCCGDRLEHGEGLRVHAGPLGPGRGDQVAGVWNVHADHIGPDGFAPEEHVWAAIDCPGSYAWLARDGVHGGLTAMMQAEVIERPTVGEECIVLAWPIEQQSERRRTSGVALFGADGRPMARGIQLWVRPNRPIGSNPPARPPG